MAKNKNTAPPADQEICLVLMTRDGKTADVHPLEVGNFKAGGWELAE